MPDNSPAAPPIKASPPPGRLKRFRAWLFGFFFPPSGTPLWQRALPYGVLGLLTVLFLLGSAYAWDYTNSPVFCGTTCHTMPPEFAAYQVSPHARVECVDCHIGEGFIATRITRKAGDVRHVIATAFVTYEYPIRAKKLRPARETCELCHFPAKFSDDSLRQKVHFLNDTDNTREVTYLALRTGGGNEREGLGRGIHWHIQSEVYFAATDALQQEIPYVRVVNPDGTETEYMSLENPLTQEELAEMELVEMDCMTCHNRISHKILPPDEAVDQAIARKQISEDIPYIRRAAVTLLSQNYLSDVEALQEIRNLPATYQAAYPDQYEQFEEQVIQAAAVVESIYNDTVFRDQQVNWESHPNNLGHSDWPGCFRCHDGQHVTEDGSAIRLECNLCHSIPQVAGPTVLEPELPLATGLQPDSHYSTHWLNIHRETYDQTCQACHDVGNPGGTDNSSFCSNSACHGTAWEYAGLDAPGISDIIEAELPTIIQPIESIPLSDLTLTWDGGIGVLFNDTCTACHNSALALGGLSLVGYNEALVGTSDHAVIIPGDVSGSILVQIQEGTHFRNFSFDQLEAIKAWIAVGAPKN